MSVNGQDPRSNVYLLDGTLQNDFTNGPAGSAAGTALGMETIREFRVEANAYSAEFGRNSGGQINVLTKSGHQPFAGSAVRVPPQRRARRAGTTSTPASKPDFQRNQFGGTLGGPIAQDRTFFFLGYEALVERLGKTISTVVPDDNARLGILPTGDGRRSNRARSRRTWRSSRAPTAPSLGQGLAAYNFPFDQTLDQHFVQGRIDYNLERDQQFFARYTLDDADQFLPTDYPQFPRKFLSRNQFFTGEYRQVLLAEHAEHGAARLQPHAHRPERPGQHVAAARRRSCRAATCMGDIDIGGLRRFGPQSSANLRLVQNVFSLQNDLRAHARPASAQGRRARRALPGQHGQPDLQPGHLSRSPNLTRVPAQPAEQLRRPDAGGAVRSLLALHAVRVLRPGRRSKSRRG